MASSALRVCRATTWSLLLAAAAAAATLPLLAPPTPPSSSSSSDGTEPVHMLCSARSRTSSPTVNAGELERFLRRVSAGPYGAVHRAAPYGVWSRVNDDAGKNRTKHLVAQCRTGVPAADCAACLAAASVRFLAAAGEPSCKEAAIWHDHGRCFLRYSDDRDHTSRFRDDEDAATLFNSSGGPARHGRAVVARLLAEVAGSLHKRGTTTKHHHDGAVAWGAAASSYAGGGQVYGLARCAPGTARGDCGRCLRGALAVAERDYNGSAGMQVLRLSCMARYESYRFYDTSLRDIGIGIAGGRGTVSLGSPAPSPATVFKNQSNTAPPINSGRHAFPPAAAHGLPSTSPPPGAPPGAQAQTSHPMKRKTLVLLIVLTATGVAVVCILFSLAHQRRWRNKRDVVDGIPGKNVYFQGEEHLDEGDEDEESTTTCQLQPYSYKILEVATCHFSNSNKLGSGGFGTVYRGTLENGSEVAVKKLKDYKRSLQELEREVSIVSKLRHENLVRFLGYCFQDEGRLLVYEYLPNNSLDKFWNKGSSQCQRLDWEAWFNIIKGVARGLRFLHKKGIIHRDLKPYNVLLDEMFNPKIADFDLVRVYNKDRTHQSTDKVAGTFGYMAPECTSGRKFQFSIKSDVYSYGVLVLEIITGRKIHTFEGHHSEGLVEHVWQHWTEGKVADVVDSDLDVEPAEQGWQQALRCVHVALLCVQSDRSRRPTMDEVIAMLSAHHNSELPAPSLPGYLHPKSSASGRALLRPLPCYGCNFT